MIDYKLEFIENLGNIQVWRVDGKLIRDTAEEEFTNYAHHYVFPDLIPEYEFWVDREENDELPFFIDHMKVEWKLMRNGMGYDKAHEIANRKEQSIRDKHEKVPVGETGKSDPRITLLESREGLDIWLVDGEIVRDEMYEDFTEGGHDLVYKFIPAGEIWIDDDVEESERPLIILHETTERNLMTQGESYPVAHKKASQVEYSARQFEESAVNIDTSLGQMLQDQMNKERYNAACYEQLSVALENVAWDGFAHWMHEAGKEETKHYRKFAKFLMDRNMQPVLTAIGAPMNSTTEPLSAFQMAMDLERQNTASIKSLSIAAENADDEDVEYWLIWAIEEQRKSEKELQDILNLLERAGNDNAALLKLDKKLGED